MGLALESVELAREVTARDRWLNFAMGQADKLLLTGLVVFFTVLARHGTSYSADFGRFCEDSEKLFAGALLALITQRAFQRLSDRSDDPPARGGKPNEPAS